MLGSIQRLPFKLPLLNTAYSSTTYKPLQVMTFNVGYFLVVIVSMGAGHLLFFNKPWHLALARVEACCETSAAAHE